MKMRHWLTAGTIILTLTILFIVVGKYTIQPVLIEPSGPVGQHQRDLLLLATFIMLAVIIPVFLLLAVIAWRYRAGNKKAKYRPDWQKNNWLEAVWWGIPILIIIFLSVIVWRSSHELDPYRPLASSDQMVDVQVVALQWKWLFIYPEYKVASVNELIIPSHTPISFAIAADAPMNSFWIPELGGQVYAMNGMITSLHLQANKTGKFFGVSSNISGEGFANMKFDVHSVEPGNYHELLEGKRHHHAKLDWTEYTKLAQPNSVSEPIWYALDDLTLFDQIVDKYMSSHGSHTEESHDKMDHSMHDMHDSEGH